MRILGLDTATTGCSATLIENETVRASRREIMRRGQSERLVPMVLDVLQEAGLALAALDAFAVTTGPGAFTGLRIGIAAARGFALATGRPAVGISSFDAIRGGLAAPAIAGRAVLLTVASGREAIFARLDRPDSDAPPILFNETPAALAPQLPAPLIIAGDGWPESEALPPETLRLAAAPIDAGVVARLAAARLRSGAMLEKPRPFYLRGADTSAPKRPPPLVRP
jgi:tRNA threonylcarbamoyladenosine biosynthesis protein TsaB